MHRMKKHDAWRVDPKWTWITVLRRPPGLQSDAEFLIEKLREMMPTISRDCAGVDDYFGLASDIRLSYVQEKLP